MTKHNFPVTRKALTLSVLLAGLVACSSTSDSAKSVSTNIDDAKYDSLQAYNDLMTTKQISGMHIFAARYPISAAKKSLEGCSTIQYVITEDLSIANIKVISTSNKDFAAAAVTNVKRAKFEDFKLANQALPIKLQTRFDFCLQEDGVTCQEKAETKVCKGTDTIYSIGSKIRKVTRYR